MLSHQSTCENCVKQFKSFRFQVLAYFLRRLSTVSHLFPHIITISNPIISRVCDAIVSVVVDIGVFFFDVPVIEICIHEIVFSIFFKSNDSSATVACQELGKIHFHVSFALIEFNGKWATISIEIKIVITDDGFSELNFWRFDEHQIRCVCNYRRASDFNMYTAFGVFIAHWQSIDICASQRGLQSIWISHMDDA